MSEAVEARTEAQQVAQQVRELVEAYHRVSLEERVRDVFRDALEQRPPIGVALERVILDYLGKQLDKYKGRPGRSDEDTRQSCLALLAELGRELPGLDGLEVEVRSRRGTDTQFNIRIFLPRRARG